MVVMGLLGQGSHPSDPLLPCRLCSQQLSPAATWTRPPLCTSRSQEAAASCQQLQVVVRAQQQQQQQQGRRNSRWAQ